MATVLLYNLHPQKAAKLKMRCRSFFIEVREVPKEDFGKPIAALLGLEAEAPVAPPEDFDEEMLYFADVAGGFLNILLDQIRRKKLGVALKAVKTEANVGFTSAQLYRELCAEREAFAQGKTAHIQ